MATRQEEVEEHPALRAARERLAKRQAEQKAFLEPKKPVAETPALAASQRPQEAPPQAPAPALAIEAPAPALETVATPAPVGEHPALTAARAKLDAEQEARGLTKESDKNWFSDLATTGKIAALYPVVGTLAHGEAAMGMRELTKGLVAKQLPAEELAGIEQLAGKKIADMKWREFDSYAVRFYGPDLPRIASGRHSIPRKPTSHAWTLKLNEMKGDPAKDKGDAAAAQEAFPMARELIEGSMQGATPSFYEDVIRPIFSNNTPQLSEEFSELLQKEVDNYQLSTKESVNKTMVAPDAKLFEPTTWFNEETKDPYHDFTGFLHTGLQQGGNFLGMAISSRLGGRFVAGQFGKMFLSRASSLEQIQKVQKVGARLGGGATGGATEMVLIRDAVFADANQRIMNEIPQEVWDGNEQYQYLREGEDGLTAEEAKQVIAYQHANKAGNTAMLFSGVLMGTPMGAFYGGLSGRSAGRQLAKESIMKQMGKGALYQTGQEMSQEFTENFVGNLAVSRVNPNQDLFEGGLEAVVTAMFISAPFGALSSIRSERGAGIDETRDKLIRKSQGWVNSANERFKYQNKYGKDSKFSESASPQDQLKAVIELERLQEKEATEFVKIAAEGRDLLVKTGAGREKLIEHDARTAGYRTDLAHITKRKNARLNARKEAREEAHAQQERADARAHIERDVELIGGNLRIVENMQTVQRGEALPKQSDYDELARAAYGKHTAAGDFVLTQRGVRAMQELAAQAHDLKAKVESGYAGDDRRTLANLREAYESLSDEEFEKKVFKDDQTGLWNRRKMDSDLKETPPAAIAMLDADALKWVNDNMSHSSGDTYLSVITKELENLGPGFTAYRRGGDEFVVTGPDQQKLQEAIEGALRKIRGAPRIEEAGKSVAVQASVGFGADAIEADLALNEDKRKRLERGERADSRVVGAVPPSLQLAAVEASPQMSLFALSRDYQKMNDDAFGKEGNSNQEELWDEYVLHADTHYLANLFKLDPVEQQHFDWVAEVANDFLPETNTNRPPVTVVNTAQQLRVLAPNQYKEIMDLPFGASGVRGLFSLDDPTHGVFLIAQTIIREAKSKLKHGHAISSWKVGKYGVNHGDKVEVINEEGEIVVGEIESVTTAQSPWMNVGTPARKETRLSAKAVASRQKLTKFRIKEDRLIKAFQKMSPSKQDDPTHPVTKQLHTTISKIAELESDIRKMVMDLAAERSRRWNESQRVTAKGDQKEEIIAKVNGEVMVFDMTKNKSAVGNLHVGRIGRQHANTWFTNLGNQEAAEDQELTREMVHVVAADTLMHETVGHYGIRGITKDWDTYIKLTHAIVDAFPEVVEQLRLMGYTYRSDLKRGEHLNDANKALLGEEVLAWKAGRMTGALDMKGMNVVQQNAVQKFFAWLKLQLINLGFDKYYRQYQAAQIRSLRRKLQSAKTEAEKKNIMDQLYGDEKTPGLVYIGQSATAPKYDYSKSSKTTSFGDLWMNAHLPRKRRQVVRAQTGLLSDKDLLSIMQRSLDFIRNGKTKWKFIDHHGNRHMLPMRDIQIFRKPVHYVLHEGLRSRTEEERFSAEELEALKSGGIKGMAVPTVAEAYKAVTGNAMPEGWKPLTPADFKDEAKRLMAEGVKTNPKELFDKAAANMSEEERGIAGKVQSMILKAKADIEHQQKGLQAKKARIELLEKRWGKEVVENDQIPIFPESATIKGWMDAVNSALPGANREGFISDMEVEASGIINKLWPSRIGSMIDRAVFAESDLIAATSITKERLDELKQSQTEMTANEAKEVVAFLKNLNATSPNWDRAFSEKLMAQNNNLSVGLFLPYMIGYNLAGQDLNIATLMAVLGPNSDLVQEYKTAMAEAESGDYNIAATANIKMAKIMQTPIDVTKAVIPKDWVAQQIEQPEYEVTVGQAGKRLSGWKTHYKKLSGGASVPGGVYDFEDLSTEWQDKLLMEQKRDVAEGPDIGFDPALGSWHLPKFVPSGTDYEGLMVGFIVPGSFETVAFWQRQYGAGDLRAQFGDPHVQTSHVKSATYQGIWQGPFGIFAHSRFAALLDADPNAPIAPNPVRQGQAFLPFEFQSDYFQKIAKLWHTLDEANTAQKQRVRDGVLLESMVSTYTANVHNYMAKQVSSILDHYVSLVVDDPDWANLSEDDKKIAREVAAAEAMLGNNFLEFEDIADNLAALIGRLKEAGRNQLAKSIKDSHQGTTDYMPFSSGHFKGDAAIKFASVSDARMFEWADDFAMEHMVTELRKAFQNFRSQAENYSYAAIGDSTDDRWTALQERGGLRNDLSTSSRSITLDSHLYPLAYAFQAVAKKTGKSSEDNKPGHRLPFMKHKALQRTAEIVSAVGMEAAGKKTPEQIAERIYADAMDQSVTTISLNVHKYAEAWGVMDDEMGAAIGNWTATPNAIPFPWTLDDGGSQPMNNITIFVAGPTKDLKRWQNGVMDSLKSSLAVRLMEQEVMSDAIQLQDLHDQMSRDWYKFRGEEIQLYGTDFGLTRSSIRITDDEAQPFQHAILGMERGQTPAEAEQNMRAHGIETFDQYSNRKWRDLWGSFSDEAKLAIIAEGGNESLPSHNWYQTFAEQWNDNKPLLITGTLPIEWDDDHNAVDSVPLKIIKKSADDGNAYRLYINGVSVGTYDYYDIHDRFGSIIGEWYTDNRRKVDLMGIPSLRPTIKALQKNIQTLEKKIKETGNAVKQKQKELTLHQDVAPDIKTSPAEKLDEAFRRVIDFHKVSFHGKTPSPDFMINREGQWQMTQILWSISEAVRRGYSRIHLLHGTASGPRAGIVRDASEGSGKFVFANSVKYELVKKELRGAMRDIMILQADTVKEPIWMDVTDDKLVPFNPDVSVSETDVTQGYLSATIVKAIGYDAAFAIANKLRMANTAASGERLLVVQAGDEMFFVQDVHGNVRSQHTTKQAAVKSRNSAVTAAKPSPSRIIGSVTKTEVGSPLIFLKTHYVKHGNYAHTGGEYKHTFDRPTFEGLRYNYDIKQIQKWNAYLKKFGLKLEEGWAKIAESQKQTVRYALGGKLAVTIDTGFADKFPNIRVEEVTGENYGFIINSDKGLVVPQIFGSEEDVNEALSNIISDHEVADGNKVAVWQVTINEALRKEHEKPVNPFISVNYQLRSNPDLEAALDKIGSNEPSLLDRFNDWKKSWRAEWNTGMFDRFYGVLRALKETDQTDLPAEDNPYIQARLTTGLSAMMKGVFEYGHPVWREGIVQSEGKGLLKILEPVANEVEAWAGYMAGVRSKRLMLEGFDKLSASDKMKVETAASHFQGKDLNEKIFNLLVYVHQANSAQLPKINRRQFLKNLGIGAVSAKVGLPTSSDVDQKAIEIVGPALKGRAKKDAGRTLPLHTKIRNPEQARFNWRKEIMEQTGASEEDANTAISRAINHAIEDQRAEDAARRLRQASRLKSTAELEDVNKAISAVETLMESGRERLFNPKEIEALIQLGDQFPLFKEVAKDYAAFNAKLLDFAQEAGVINPETRVLWENADYIPFYRIADDRLVGPLAKDIGVANQRSPIKTLKGGEDNLGDLIHNIFMNATNLVDSSVKNHAARKAVAALLPTGMMRKQPMAMSKELIPMEQVGKILKQHGIDVKSLPDEVLSGLRTMFAIQPPKGNGIISVMEAGKQQYYYVEDSLLYRSLTSINMENFGNWMNLLRAPKRLLTSWVTLDPGFMAANFVRDAMSAFVLSRDHFVPLFAGLKGFANAITEGDTMRVMISSGAAFDSGNINQGDPKSTHRYIKRAMKDAGFQRTLLNTPRKLYEAWKRIGSATENANRIAVYEAAIRGGKSKAQAAFESKDLMDFSMGGDWPFIQFLIQTVPFMGARMQGLQRLGRGAAESPLAFTLKGSLVGLAGLALWFAFRDDERYKELEDWDKDTYFHWWIGDTHYRLPKGFEVGAIFNTIPERIFEYLYSKENDAGKYLMKRFGYMLAETFNMNPIPQAIRPMVEGLANYNFFTGNNIESPWEEERLPEDRYRYYTSPTMIELAATLPDGMDTVLNGKINSPLQLQNLYSGYTGTIGRYFMMASDVAVRYLMNYPEPPARTAADLPVVGRFYRGDEVRRNRYEQEFYNELSTVTQVMNSLRFADKELDINDPRYDEIEKEYLPYVDRAREFEKTRRNVSRLNKEVKEIYMDRTISRQKKRAEIDEIQREKNAIFKEAYDNRPSAAPKEGQKETQQLDIESLIDGFDPATPEDSELRAVAPFTADLLASVATMPPAQLVKLAKSANYSSREA